jgi:hypothetical protein
MLILIVTLLVAGCGGDDDPATTASPSSSPPTLSSSAPTTPSETAFAGTEIVVEVSDGKVSPPTHRVKIAKGTAVRLLVTSDVDEELHVHGYDILQELPAGQQATLDFTADQAGVFEVESEKNGLQLVQLEVR